VAGGQCTRTMFRPSSGSGACRAPGRPSICPCKVGRGREAGRRAVTGYVITSRPFSLRLKAKSTHEGTQDDGRRVYDIAGTLSPSQLTIDDVVGGVRRSRWKTERKNFEGRLAPWYKEHPTRLIAGANAERCGFGRGKTGENNEDPACRIPWIPQGCGGSSFCIYSRLLSSFSATTCVLR
jgi:hypothetical protein